MLSLSIERFLCNYSPQEHFTVPVQALRWLGNNIASFSSTSQANIISEICPISPFNASTSSCFVIQYLDMGDPTANCNENAVERPTLDRFIKRAFTDDTNWIDHFGGLLLVVVQR